jgi:transcriptional regulator with XRE-family HTH domain
MTKLQAARIQRGMSQTMLAAAAGKLSPSDISRFERGYGRPYPGQAVRIAEALGMPAEDLLEPADAAEQQTVA